MNKILRVIAVSITAIGLFALILEVSGTSLQAVVSEAQGKDASLTGRTWLWRDVVRLGMDSPILGSGYGSFWIPSVYSKLSPEVDNRPAEAHNGYLETFANLGLIGLGLLFLIIIQSIRSAATLFRSDFEYGRLRLALLFSVVVMNYSEATFPRGTHLWWFGFLVVAIYARQWVSWPMPATSTAFHEATEISNDHEEGVFESETHHSACRTRFELAPLSSCNGYETKVAS